LTLSTRVVASVLETVIAGASQAFILVAAATFPFSAFAVITFRGLPARTTGGAYTSANGSPPRGATAATDDVAKDAPNDGSTYT